MLEDDSIAESTRACHGVIAYLEKSSSINPVNASSLPSCLSRSPTSWFVLFLRGFPMEQLDISKLNTRGRMLGIHTLTLPEASRCIERKLNDRILSIAMDCKVNVRNKDHIFYFRLSTSIYGVRIYCKNERYDKSSISITM